MKKTPTLQIIAMLIISTNICAKTNKPTYIPEAIDMGVSVKWSPCNLGAEWPEQTGNHYAWAETESKDNYAWYTYTYFDTKNKTMKKYNNDNIYKKTDNKTTLDPKDDAATILWGKEWRMPTEAELDELLDKCEWIYTDNYNWSGVSGYLVKSRINGNKLFFPFGGNIVEKEIYDVETSGSYWTSSVLVKACGYANCLLLLPELHRKDSDSRASGLLIRPVKNR